MVLLHFDDFKNLRHFLALFSPHSLENDRRVIKFVKNSARLFALPLFISDL